MSLRALFGVSLAFLTSAMACSGPEHSAVSTTSQAIETGVVGGATLALLNEAIVDPDGNDGGYELVELRGTPGGLLTGFYLVVMEGDTGGNQGRTDLVVDLSASAFGQNGLLVVRGTTTGHTLPAQTTVVPVAGFDLENMGSVSLLLVYSPTTPIVQGKDYDGAGGAFVLEAGAQIVDAIGWGTKVYGGATFPRTPDALTRFANDDTPISAAAWFGGDMTVGVTSTSYDAAAVTANFPPGGTITPGAPNVGSKPGVDAGGGLDVGVDVGLDAGALPDTTTADTADSAAPDTELPDTQTADTETADTASADSETPDAETADGEATDAATPDSDFDAAIADIGPADGAAATDAPVADSTVDAPPADGSTPDAARDAQTFPDSAGRPDTTPVNAFDDATGGGCSCRTGAETGGAKGEAALAVVALATAVARRRRRRH